MGYGRRELLPEPVIEAGTFYGGRWIFPNDILGDRHGVYGPRKEALATLLNDGPLKQAANEAWSLYADGAMGKDSTNVWTLYTDDNVTIVGSPLRSHGYFWASAWLNEDNKES